jgi:hypothetical protein
MIVFINGPFGIGKSTVADLLVARLPSSLIFDAEFVGYFLRRVIPASEQTSDFQDLPMWRALTITTARLLRAQYGWTLVMPMTIWHRPYFDEILGGLRADDPDVHHFCLTATMPTLEARIRASNEAVEWRLAHAERCLTAFQSPAFATQLPTDGKTPEAITEQILAQLPHEQTAAPT